MSADVEERSTAAGTVPSNPPASEKNAEGCGSVEIAINTSGARSA
ncbi:hypothetical protein [Botrimarina mediterranea]|nr:hypothetical protein [Botrimarina mediterranea]